MHLLPKLLGYLWKPDVKSDCNFNSSIYIAHHNIPWAGLFFYTQNSLVIPDQILPTFMFLIHKNGPSMPFYNFSPRPQNSDKNLFLSSLSCLGILLCHIHICDRIMLKMPWWEIWHILHKILHCSKDHSPFEFGNQSFLMARWFTWWILVGLASCRYSWTISDW